MASGGNSDGRSRPFYELPSHIKPCSRIIQETRMQLKYSRKGPMREVGVGDMTPLPLLNGRRESSDSEVSTRGYGVGVANTMRPVNTQRPFTPRDSVSLWGVSARKRPPSAITLSRLSMPEDIDESRPTSSTSNYSNNKQLPTHIFGSINPRSKFSGSGRIRTIEPKNSLGSLSSQGSSLAGIEESDTDETCMMDTGRSSAGVVEGNVEKARLQIKSLSLQNVTSRQPSWTLGAIRTTNAENNIDYIDNSIACSKKARHSDVDVRETGAKKSIGGENNFKNGHNVDNNALSTTRGQEEDPYQQINNLEVAIEYLRCFVMECSTSDKPPKADLISILKIIKEKVYHEECLEEGLFTRLRKQLLELIFRLVERNQNDEDVLFWSSFVLLHCNIIGNNLTTVFKMVFKSSRYKDYKDIILDTEYLEVLMKSFSQICPKTQTESMIYGYGTLKFICSDHSVLNRVIDLNLIPIMALHLKILNCEIEMGRGMGRISDGILNGTFQLTSILRSVVGEDASLAYVVQSGLLEELCTTITWAMDDIDVLTNIVRILSVVSMDSVCCQVMYNNDILCPTVVRILKLWYAKDDVMVRLAYCLGNLLANSDDMRIKLFEEPDAFQYILKVISHYLDKSCQSPVSIDILIKTTRILANWVLNPIVGSEICDEPYLSELLFQTLQLKDIPQELTLCVMCALNNTSFYINYTDLDEGTMKTAEHLLRNVGNQQLEVRAEAVKVLGNLTRNEDVRLMAANYLGNILSSLDEDQAAVELICTTCGVLINIVIEESVKTEFLKNEGVGRVIRVLEQSSDMMVSLITCQVLWNLLISHENQGFDLNQCITSAQRVRLKQVLLNKLDNLHNTNSYTELNECDNNSDEGDNAYSTFKQFSDDFKTVAEDLVEKL